MFGIMGLGFRVRVQTFVVHGLKPGGVSKDTF